MLICPYCNTPIKDGIFVCPNCHSQCPVDLNTAIDRREGREGFAQPQEPKLDKVDIAESKTDVPFLEDTQRVLNIKSPEEKTHISNIIYSKKTYKQLSRNWVKRGAFIVVFAFALVVLVWQYFEKTDSGQLILARSFRAKSPQAYWIVGEEFLNEGDIVNAIRAFTLADAKDPANADGLLALASAYEATNLPEQAEGIYKRIIKDISPARPETYRALVRMLTAQNRLPEVADTLRLAYDNTGIANFKEQLVDMLPESPEVSLPGGRYNSEKTVTLSSPQGYEIYYLMDDGTGKLPQDGILYNGKPIKIPEGAVKLRAVCKSVNLVSEPTEVKYVLIYPSPLAPKVSLASGTYSKRIPITLRNADPKEKDLTIHYTIDGSVPTENSPIFDGTPIELPSGRVTLHAFSQNSRGKTSSNQVVNYKFDVKPFPEKPYNEEDVFNGLALYETPRDVFFNQFGTSEIVKDTKYGIQELPAKIYTYDWGTAEFVLTSNKWLLAKLDMNQKLTEAPRGMGFGQSEEKVIKAFKDMGQKPNLDGSRGLYYDLPYLGAVDYAPDGTRFIRYECQTKKGVIWVLEYFLDKAGKVNHITHFYR